MAPQTSSADAPRDPNAEPSLLPHHTVSYLAANKAPSIVAVTVTLSVLSTIFVAARLFTRQKIMGKMHLDDWLVASSIPCLWTCVATAIVATQNGNGKHFDTLSLNDKQGAIFWTTLGIPFAVTSFSIPKLAVVALLQRLLVPRKWHRIFLWTLALLCVGAQLGCVVILYAQCSPTESLWNFSITEKTCIDKWVLVDFSIFAGGFSAVTDLYLAVYPAVVLWKLQLNVRKKIALCVALGIGSIATIVAIYKCTRLPSLASDDFSSFEAATIIIACCIPVLQPLVDLLFGRRTLNGSSGYQNYGSSGRGRMKGDMELDDNGRNRSKNQSHVGTKHTVHVDSRIRDTDVGSQESILRDDDVDTNRQGHGWRKKERNGRIVRTDVVTITYNQGDDSRREAAPADDPTD
ncbi:uncharacterized protein J7T54_003371 [Emericellopsis cladophorae]|uniref:Rhodopsin domain-containing protein n=1 Tax=Emericellopsis cladophorae TaxID=2686198 RepID=A0A9Q0B9V2_9HYPO|nr:uncharacterized protein J7T54_003371 [Emericellopsis cladophorae]KAI6778592.1 hypothetical protein J7T54_003371 [Emericellopsis cladophorae]